MTFHVPNESRNRSGHLASTEADGNNGYFLMKSPGGARLQVIASDGEGWEHVSVSLVPLDYRVTEGDSFNRCPTWEEMAWVKSIFWDAEDCAVQYHPPKSQHVNYHPYCLHLWRCNMAPMPMPPSYMVGPKEGI